MEEDRVIRPAAVLEERDARVILAELERLDVGKGGVWSASTALWQRYDHPWNGQLGARGDAAVVGSLFVTYNSPAAYWVTVHRVTVTAHGAERGWTVDRLADELLAAVGLTLAECPRADLGEAPALDPFRKRPERPPAS